MFPLCPRVPFRGGTSVAEQVSAECSFEPLLRNLLGMGLRRRAGWWGKGNGREPCPRGRLGTSGFMTGVPNGKPLSLISATNGPHDTGTVAYFSLPQWSSLWLSDLTSLSSCVKASRGSVYTVYPLTSTSTHFLLTYLQKAYGHLLKHHTWGLIVCLVQNWKFANTTSELLRVSLQRSGLHQLRCQTWSLSVLALTQMLPFIRSMELAVLLVVTPEAMRSWGEIRLGAGKEERDVVLWRSNASAAWSTPYPCIWTYDLIPITT